MGAGTSINSASVERANQFYQGLIGLGYNFFAGVPCSLLNGLYAVFERTQQPYYPASREDLALGLAAGAVLAGRRPVVLMQNSGLGVSVNALQSLQQMYALPVLVVVSWRGHGPDAPEHIEMGARMLPLLDVLDIPYRLATAPDAFDHSFHQHPGPIALIVRPGEFV